MSAERRLLINSSQGKDGVFVATIPKLPGITASGVTYSETIQKVQILALRRVADDYEKGKHGFDILHLSFFVD